MSPKRGQHIGSYCWPGSHGRIPTSQQRFLPDCSRAHSKVLLYIGVLCGAPSPPRRILGLPYVPKWSFHEGDSNRSCTDITLGWCPPHWATLPMAANAGQALSISLLTHRHPFGGGSHLFEARRPDQWVGCGVPAPSPHPRRRLFPRAVRVLHPEPPAACGR